MLSHFTFSLEVAISGGQYDVLLLMDIGSKEFARNIYLASLRDICFRSELRVDLIMCSNSVSGWEVDNRDWLFAGEGTTGKISVHTIPKAKLIID